MYRTDTEPTTRTVNEGQPEGRWERALQPRADVYEAGDHFVIEIELPGVEAAKVDLQVEGDELRVTATREGRPSDGGYLLQERRAGSYVRNFQLGELVDRDNIAGKLEGGVLRIQVPKSPRALPRRIQVQ